MSPFAVRVGAVLGRITLPFGWTTRLVDVGTTHLALQVCDPTGTDNVTGEPLVWHGRKWLLSEHMTDGEIVQTLFKATMTAVEHEVRESFLYRGQAIYDPHYDVEKLVALRASPGALKERS